MNESINQVFFYIVSPTVKKRTYLSVSRMCTTKVSDYIVVFFFDFTSNRLMMMGLNMIETKFRCILCCIVSTDEKLVNNRPNCRLSEYWGVNILFNYPRLVSFWTNLGLPWQQVTNHIPWNEHLNQSSSSNHPPFIQSD